MSSCEDCSEGNKEITDSYGDPVEYQCPYVEPPPEESKPEDKPEETSQEDKPEEKPAEPAAPAPPGGNGEEEGSSYLAMSAAVLMTATTLMAWAHNLSHKQ